VNRTLPIDAPFFQVFSHYTWIDLRGAGHLRHTAASLLAGGGCDIITLQNILGHKSLSMTQRYAHLIPERFEKSRQIMQDFWRGSVSQTGDTKLTQSDARAEERLVIH